MKQHRMSRYNIILRSADTLSLIHVKGGGYMQTPSDLIFSSVN